MTQDDAIVGETLDAKYHVQERIGRGGMGAVYLATHIGTGQIVALKVIAPELTSDERIVERFKREARAAGQLRHPNVISVTDFGFAIAGGERVAYLVMERLRGQTLADLLEREGTLPLRRAVGILQQVCAAVEEAHKHGIVHRDLKPENIWLEPRAHRGYNVKVLDFGVAKLREEAPLDTGPLDLDAEPPPIPSAAMGGVTMPGEPDPAGATLAATAPSDAGSRPRMSQDDRITQFGTLLGTPFYMSPEQWLHRRVDGRSDVYSVGIIAYRMLAGAVPFDGQAAPIAMQHLRAPPPSLTAKAKGVLPGTAAVVMTALAKDPDNRPASAQSFAAALAASVEGTGAILARAIALVATHFTRFVGINARVLGPALLACTVRLATRLLVNAHLVPVKVGTVVSAVCLGVYMISMLLLQPVVAALFAPRARDAVLAPHEPARPGPTLAEATQCLRGTVAGTLALLGCFAVIIAATRAPLLYLAQRRGLFPDGATDMTSVEFIVHMLLEIPALLIISLALARFILYPSVVRMEGIGGIAALRRSAALTRPFRRTAAILLWLHVGVRFAIVWLLWLALAQLAKVSLLTLIDTSSDSVTTDIGMLVIPAIQFVAWTVTFTAGALLYLNARQMEGTTLDGMTEHGAVDEAPASSTRPIC